MVHFMSVDFVCFIICIARMDSLLVHRVCGKLQDNTPFKFLSELAVWESEQIEL